MNLFVGTEQSDKYQTFRPNYPEEVYDFIVNYCKETNPNLDTAIDVGCGTGQSTVPLCKYFRHVIGVDISETQIETACKAHHDKNVTFRVSSAEDLAFQASDSVDLVTVAAAMHWIQPDSFYSEVSRYTDDVLSINNPEFINNIVKIDPTDSVNSASYLDLHLTTNTDGKLIIKNYDKRDNFRVLRRNGSLIIYSYGRCYLDDAEADRIVHKFWGEDLKDYWDLRWRLADNKYKDITLPFPEWIRNDEFVIHSEWSVDEFVGYMSTWSAWQTCLKKHPDSDILITIHQQLKSIYNGKNKQHKVKITWPLFMLCGHKEKD